jgi:hypothetical protein
MELSELKKRWNEVLDELEATNRIAWLVFFDARLAALVDGALTLDFSDANKFPDGHDLKSAVSSTLSESLIETIKNVTGLTVTLEYK